LQKLTPEVRHLIKKEQQILNNKTIKQQQEGGSKLIGMWLKPEYT